MMGLGFLSDALVAQRIEQEPSKLPQNSLFSFKHKAIDSHLGFRAMNVP
jgi:hypothetical protein